MTIVERLQQSGIRRSGSPSRGFRYALPGGGRPPAADRARIEALRIPPAWTRVAISPTPGSAVQAVGMDAAGRWQYLYHPARVARREREKHQRLVRFIAALPRMRRAVRRDLARPGLPREKVLAGILQILGLCFLRPGSKDYADENGSYGIATLRRRHVRVEGDRVRFDFPGKSGRRNQRELRDRRLARLVRELLRYPGEVFKYRAEDGSLVDVRRRHINAYIKEVMGEAFSAKDFRTWAANLLCASALVRAAPRAPVTAHARKRAVSAALREVSHHLGNTPAVARASYVFDAVLDAYQNGRMTTARFADLAPGARRRRPAVGRIERALIALLKQRALRSPDPAKRNGRAPAARAVRRRVPPPRAGSSARAAAR